MNATQRHLENPSGGIWIERHETGASNRYSRAPRPWNLLVKDSELIAIRTIPYNGQECRSTEDRRNRADKASRFGMDAGSVARFYVENTATDLSVATILSEYERIAVPVEVA